MELETDAVASETNDDVHNQDTADVNAGEQIVDSNVASPDQDDTAPAANLTEAVVETESPDDVVFELIPENEAEYADGEGLARPQVNPERAVGIRLTVGALLFVSALLFTFVIATHQNKPVRPSASTEETRENLEEVETVKQDFERDDAPGRTREPQQERERELQEALDAAREELEALKAAVKSAEQKNGTEKLEDQLIKQRLEAERQRVERERAEQEQLQAELEQQRRDQEQREAELEELLELEMASDEKLAQ